MPGQESQYSVISLFSGAMGLDLGMARTGRFRLLACVEKDKASCETIRANQVAGRLPRELEVIEQDITKLDPAELMDKLGIRPGEIDVLVGGPPCQSFSTAGKRGSVQDTRGTLLWHYLRFVQALSPKFFVMENVRGLLSASMKHRSGKGVPHLDPEEMPGSVVRAFAEELNSKVPPSYRMDCFEVNAVNYGAPQLRERAIFIGNRFNSVVEFPAPTHGPGGHLPWGTLGEALSGVSDPNPVRLEFSPRKLQYLSMVPPGSNWRSLPKEVQEESMGSAYHIKGGRSGWWRRLSFDLPCPTLVTMPNHSSTSLCHPNETRALTLREYARVQEFPDDWVFMGTPSELFRQVGNAVPVRLGEVTGQVLLGAMDDLRATEWEPRCPEPVSYRIVYVQSHVRTRSWFKDGEAYHRDDDGDAPSPKTHPKVTELKA